MAKNKKCDEDIYEVYWEGPFTVEEIKQDKNNKFWVLYAIYTPHPLYGSNALVYIGKAKNGALIRLKTHSNSWFDQRNIGGEIYVASIAKFDNWGNARDWKTYTNCLQAGKTKLIQAIESLFIFALQPTYNSTNKKSAPMAKGLRVFNTGKIASIPYEVSAMYHIE